MNIFKLAVVFAISVQQAVAAAIQATHFADRASKVLDLDCSVAVPLLTTDDCNRLSQLGFAQAGVNSGSNAGNDSIWVGPDGDYTAEFSNTSGEDIILIVWNQAAGFASSFVLTSQPQLTVSLAAGNGLSVSFANGADGAWSALYPATMMNNGQVNNTWGEFSTGDFATVDVSREVNMAGDGMSIITPGGCTSDMTSCVFVCNTGNECGDSNSYSLLNCTGPASASGTFDGQPSGGCQGWTLGSALQVAVEQ